MFLAATVAGSALEEMPMTEPGPAEATERIDAMLAVLPEEQRRALQALRETIAATAPDAVEAISYQMPAFRYHGRGLVSYSAFRSHCSLFPMSGEVIDAHRDELAGFIASKGTLHFTPERPIPRDLVERIVRARMAQIDARAALRR
jgi:uncharacterized protein YdhG (YjbR/CyaY superfamily)